jgi:hypothetical protein
MAHANINSMIAPRSRETLKLRPGMHVICPHCERVMLKCIKQPIAGNSDWYNWFKAVEFTNNKPEAMPWCPYDGYLFYDAFTGVYTRELGWTF